MMHDARELGRYIIFIGCQLAVYLVLVSLLDAVRPPSVPFLTLPLLSVVLIHVTVFPRMLVTVLGCEVVTPDTHPRLQGHIERLAERADIDVPRVAIWDYSEANALATGVAGVNGTIVLHSGLIEQLSPSELDGVLAHEVAHLTHHDALKAMGFATVVLHIVGIVPSLAVSALHLTGVPRELVVLGTVAGAGIAVLAYLRRNEYRADANAACLLGNSKPLADALAKTMLHQKSARAVLTSARPAGGFSPSLTALFTTHPKTQHRVERLLDETN